MDINGLGGPDGMGMPYGIPYGAAMLGALPIGFGMTPVANDAAMDGYAGLTEAEKEKLILRCKDAKTKEQRQEIVDSLAPGTDVREVYEEEWESMF